MIPFDGKLAENFALPLAEAAYVSTAPPTGYIGGSTAFEILADTAHPDFQQQLKTANAHHRNMLKSMFDQPTRPALDRAERANQAAFSAMVRSVTPNLHFGWVCLGSSNTLIIAFRGTEFFKDWVDDFDFVPAPYAPVPGRGTVHQGFQLVYYAIRANLRTIVAKFANNCRELFITGHSLGGALCALAAPDLLNDIASSLSPTVYTWAEPRVGHSDFGAFYNARINVSYRIANIWDVVPHLPPVLAAYEHEGKCVTINSGFSLDIVRNHVLITGYAPGIATWNANHPGGAAGPLVGHTT